MYLDHDAIERAGQHLAEDVRVIAGHQVGLVAVVTAGVVRVQRLAVEQRTQIVAGVALWVNVRPNSSAIELKAVKLAMEPPVWRSTVSRRLSLRKALISAVRSAMASCSASDWGVMAVDRSGAMPSRMAWPVSCETISRAEAGVHRLVRIFVDGEVKELEAVRFTLVIGVRPAARVRDDQQLRRVKGPRQRAAQRVRLFKDGHGAEHGAKDAHDLEIVGIDVVRVRQPIAPNSWSDLGGSKGTPGRRAPLLRSKVQDGDPLRDRAIEEEILAVNGGALRSAPSPCGGW